MSPERDPEADPALDAVARLLDAAAVQEEGDLRAAEAVARAPGSERVGEFLRRAWGEPARAPSAAGRRWPLFAAAAACILICAFAVFRPWRGSGEGPRGEYLAEPTFSVLEPAERVARWERIAWSGPSAATYRVRVRDAQSGDTLLGPTHAAGTELSLDPRTTQGWPRKILVEVELRRADGSWLSAPPRPSELRP